MPRGFKVDHQATLLRFGGKRWKLGTSFVSQPKKIKGECDEPICQGECAGAVRAHLILVGKDKAPIRAEIFRRNREADGNIVGGTARCWKCDRLVLECSTGFEVYADFARLPVGEWDHIRNKPGERCDCPENGRVACRKCHSERHPKPQFGKVKTTAEMS